jgi:hypothetical protein
MRNILENLEQRAKMGAGGDFKSDVIFAEIKERAEKVRFEGFLVGRFF